MTAALEQNVVSLEAPAPAFLASVSEPKAIRVLLIQNGVTDRGLLTDKLSKQGFAVLKSLRWPARLMPPAMSTSSFSIVTSRRFPVSICWASFAGWA